MLARAASRAIPSNLDLGFSRTKEDRMSDFLYKHRRYRPFVRKTRVILKLILLILEIIRRFFDLLN